MQYHDMYLATCVGVGSKYRGCYDKWYDDETGQHRVSSSDMVELLAACMQET